MRAPSTKQRTRTRLAVVVNIVGQGVALAIMSAGGSSALAAPAPDVPPRLAPLLDPPTPGPEGEEAGSALGRTVAGGDVNNDGYADLVVGAPSFGVERAEEGRAYLYLGGAKGLETMPTWTADPTDQQSTFYGSSVAVVGDVNGDGFADVLVGAPLADGVTLGEGVAYLYLGKQDGLDATPAWIGEPANTPKARFGTVAAAGDVNGDGLADFLVGAPGSGEVGSSWRGRVYIYLGNATQISQTPAWVIEGAGVQDGFGSAVAGAGDVNGDGFADILVGAPDANGDINEEGRAYLYYGQAKGEEVTLQLAWSADDSDQLGAQYGSAVAGIGDVNADGFSDIAIGAPGEETGLTDEGRVYVFHGSANGPVRMPSRILTVAGKANARFGMSLAGIGDVNGDGFADMVAGAQDFLGSLTQEGRMYLFVGGPGGIGAAPSLSYDPTNQGASLFAGALSAAGDIDNDGYADVVAGAAGWNGTNGTASGRVYVFHGSARGLRQQSDRTLAPSEAIAAQFGEHVRMAGDVDGDGYGDLLIGAPSHGGGAAYLYRGSAQGLLPEPAWFIAPVAQNDARFGERVAGAGDINGDGYADIMVSAPYYDGQNGIDEGRVYLFYGSANGLPQAPNMELAPQQSGSGENFGSALASAGDVDGDGYADILIGARNYENRGKAYMFRGSPTGLMANDPWTAAPVDQAQAGFGASVAGGFDVNGDGYADVLIGAPMVDGAAVDQGRAYVFLGSESGLESSAKVVLVPQGSESEQFGTMVAGAGDINGDGYADVLVSALYQSGGQGGIYLFHGSANGPSTTPAWLDAPSAQSQSAFGIDVAASDLDGDGITDIAIGAPNKSGEGHVYVYLGSKDGEPELALDLDPTNQQGASAGRSLAIGDVNGDGFGDLIVGASDYDGAAANQGLALLFYGGDGQPGRDRRLQQLDVDGATRLGTGMLASENTVFITSHVTHEGPGYAGGKLILEVEVKRVGTPFDGYNLVRSDPVVSGAVAKAMVTGLDRGGYHWRARVRYPGELGAGRWVSFGTNDATAADFRVVNVVVPVLDGGPTPGGGGFDDSEIKTLYSCNCQTGSGHLPSLLLLAAVVALVCRRRSR